jgi:hypothetical protein
MGEYTDEMEVGSASADDPLDRGDWRDQTHDRSSASAHSMKAIRRL